MTTAATVEQVGHQWAVRCSRCGLSVVASTVGYGLDRMLALAWRHRHE